MSHISGIKNKSPQPQQYLQLDLPPSKIIDNQINNLYSKRGSGKTNKTKEELIELRRQMMKYTNKASSSHGPDGSRKDDGSVRLNKMKPS